MDYDPVDQLDREWRQLASGPRLRATLRQWAEDEPALTPFPDPGSLIRFLRAPGRYEEKDTLLAALLRLARSEPLAGRVLLEALLPGLKRLARRVILDARDRDELWQQLLACAWEQIRSYPAERRPRRIALSLLLETRSVALARLASERRPLAAPSYQLAPASTGSATDLDGLLAQAVRAGALDEQEAELIARTRIDGAPLVAIARAQGTPYDALRIRRQRAERRLRLFLGVRFEPEKAHCMGAREAGGSAGSTGGGAAPQPLPRR